MKNKLLIITMLLLIGKLDIMAFSGIVYNDKNKNGIHDSNEPGIENIVVSDGTNVVKTDSQGQYYLPERDSIRFISVYIPGDKKCTNWYHKVNNINKKYDFALTQSKSEKSVKFIQISDTETSEYQDWLNNIKEYVKHEDVDFLIHTGDICYIRGMTWHAENVTTKQMGLPVYYCIGNHDMIAGDYGEQYFENNFGPSWYAFEKGNILFVVTPMSYGDVKPSYNNTAVGTWLKNLLKSYSLQKPKIFFNHNLLTEKDNFIFNITESDSINLNDHNLKSWIYGHWHTNRVKRHGDSGIISYCTATAAKGGIDHTPSSFRVVDVDYNGNTTSELRWTYVNDLLEIVTPEHNDAIFTNDSLQISVNSYHSAIAVEKIECRIWHKDNPPNKRNMEGYENFINLYQNSDFNWSASYPFKNYEKGNYVLSVNAFFKNGFVIDKKVDFKFTKNEKTKVKITKNWKNLLGNPAHIDTSVKSTGKNLKLNWVKNTGGSVYMSSPLIYRNKVITAIFDDNNAEQCAIVALDAQTGAEKWRYNTNNSVKNTIVIADGKVIATDICGLTYALNAQNGKIIWKADILFNRMPAFVSGIVTDDKTVYTGFGNALCALDIKNGKELWRNQSWNGGVGSVATMTIADDVLITSSQWRGLYGHNSKTGELLWHQKEDGLRFINSSAVYYKNNLWLAEKTSCYKVDHKTGKIINSFNTGMNHTGNSVPVFTDKNIVLGSSHPGIAAFDKITHENIWEFHTRPALFYTPPYMSGKQQSLEATPLLIDDKLFFGGMDGYFYLLDANSGKLLWEKNIGTPVMTTAAYSGNSFFVCDFAGNVYCWSLK